ncbi:MAG TPA: cupin domain-containing protein [Terriglobia bacterium]|nr:cupin domain-containing protein [Terriglobia bacterium]
MDQLPIGRLQFCLSGTSPFATMWRFHFNHIEESHAPPLHLHLNQEEWFYIMEGEVVFQVGGQRLHLHAGESVLAPRRIPHTFSSVAATPSRMLIAFCPAGKMEQFFRDVENPKAPVEQAAFWRRYDMELVGPSPFRKS